MLIAIDHGNKQIKTIHSTFTSGLVIGDSPPAYSAKTMEYGGRYCSLSEQRVPYMKDKTEDETFFILSLFGLAYEIDAAGLFIPNELMDVQLAIGLPPAHFGHLRDKFSSYFLNRDLISFTFQKRDYNLYIDKVRVYPQAFAAISTIIGQLQAIRKSVVIDIGGYTADYMALLSGCPDMGQCDSLDNGVILLYHSITSAVSAELDLLLDEAQIDVVLTGADHGLPSRATQIIEEKTALFVDRLLGSLGERQLDLRSARPIFVGGGAVLLRRFLESNRKVQQPIFIEDIQANVKGYQRLFELESKAG